MGEVVALKLLKEKLTRLSKDQAVALKTRLLEMGITIEFDVFELKPIDRSLLLPASYVQHRLWFSNQRNQQGDATYNLPVAIRLGGVINIQALEAAFQYIVQRHEALRTTFGVQDGEIVQIIYNEHYTLPVRVIAERDLRRQVKTHAMALFDLEQGPLIKAELLQISPSDNVLLINLHHIISDGWSQNSLLLPELFAAYCAVAQGKKVELPTLSVQYADYAYWQRQQDLSVHLEYWKTQLAGYDEGVLIPTDFPRAGAAGSHIKVLTRHYAPELSARLEDFSRAHGCTLFMTLLAGYALVLQGYTGRGDICIGVTTAGRTMPQLEPLIGFFINILPLRLQVSPELCVSDFMVAVRQATLEAFDHQDLPFEHLLNELSSRRNAKVGSLVPLMLRHQNFPRVKIEDVLPHDLKHVTPLYQDGEENNENETLDMAAKCEIDLAFYGGGDQPLEVVAEYNADLFKQESIERLLQHLDNVLHKMMANSDLMLSELTLLSEQEQQALLCKGHGRVLPGAVDPAANVVALFEHHAVVTPDKIACYAGDDVISYGELNARANRVAHYLLKVGVNTNDVIGVYLERSIETLVALLAIFKAGAAYCPLDVNYPQNYLEVMINNAELSQVLCCNTTQNFLPSVVLEIFNIDTLAPVLALEAMTNPGLKVSPEQLAYVLYTSGSTGTPKGVEVPHAQLTNCLQNYCATYPLDINERIAQRTTTAFAVAVKEIFAPLVAGASLVILADDISKDAGRLAAAIKYYGITRLSIVPSHLEAVLGSGADIAAQLASLRVCITAGEPLPKSLADRVKKQLPATRLLNNYGCTELNDMTYQDVSALVGDYQFVPIGFPIANTDIYVLDGQLRPVPVGVPGELCVGGLSLPKGYRGRPDLTAEKFITHPFSTAPGARLFKTGDCVKRLPCGALEYLGRQDFQIKVRGFRIDTRQVEYVMGQYPGVAMCIAWHWVEGDLLVGYFKSVDLVERVDKVHLKRYLSRQLPGYMVPDVLVSLDEFPRLPNGKVDRRNLPPPVIDTSNWVAPQSDTEKTMAGIWAQVLNVPSDKIGREDNFFELGGHSLLAIKVVSLLKREFSLELSIKAFYNQQTLSDCAQQAKAINFAPTLATQVDDEYQHPVLPNNYRFLRRKNRNHFNVTSLLEVKNGTAGNVHKVMEILMRSHDALRSVWVNNQQDWVVKVRSLDKVLDWFEEITVPVMAQQQRCLAIESVCNYYQRCLDIEKTLVKVVYIHVLGASRDRVFFVFHHLIMDAYSLNVFTEDFVSLFLDAATGKNLEFRHGGDRVAKVAQYLVEYANNKAPRRFHYWRSLPWHELKDPPFDSQAWELASTTDEVAPTICLSSLSQYYSALFLARVQDSGYREIHYLILVVMLAYKKWSGSEHLFFTLINNGRFYPETELDLTRTIGWLAQYTQFFIRSDNFSSVDLALEAIKSQLDVMADDGLSFVCLKHMVKDDFMHAEMNKLPKVQLDLNYMPKILTSEYAQGDPGERMLGKARESRGDNDGWIKKDFTRLAWCRLSTTS